MTDERRPRGWLKRYTDRVLSGPQNTPEEIAQFKAERESLLGTARQWAEMQPDWTIQRHISQWLPNGIKAQADDVSEPGDPNYEMLRLSHKLEKPGDASTIFKRLIDDVWVVQDSLE